MESGVRRIFYDKVTGAIIAEIGRSAGMIIPTIERDIETYSVLSERNVNTFDVIELSFSAYEQDFAEGGSIIGVNVETKIPIFEYPNPEEPENPIVVTKPLSVEVERLKEEDLNNKEAIAELYLMSLGGF